MKSCKDCGSELLYLFEFNGVALFGCTLCKRVYFMEVTKIDMVNYKQVTISNIVEKAIQEYIKNKK